MVIRSEIQDNEVISDENYEEREEILQCTLDWFVLAKLREFRESLYLMRD